MIKVLGQIKTSGYVKVKVMEYDSLESFKTEVLKHYPRISISLPDEDEEFWFGIQYGSKTDGFWFRWLMAIVDTERGCLYSRGDNDCVSYLGLPKDKQHCSKEVYAMLKEIKDEVSRRTQRIIFVE